MRIKARDRVRVSIFPSGSLFLLLSDTEFKGFMMQLSSKMKSVRFNQHTSIRMLLPFTRCCSHKNGDSPSSVVSRLLKAVLTLRLFIKLVLPTSLAAFFLLPCSSSDILLDSTSCIMNLLNSHPCFDNVSCD